MDTALETKLAKVTCLQAYQNSCCYSKIWLWEICLSQVYVMLHIFIFLKGLQMSFSINRFSQGQQLVTKLVTAPVACGAVMVPSTMFMGQVVTAYPTFAAQQQQTQTLSITQQQQQQQQQQSQQDHQQQLTTVQQPAQSQLTQHPQQFLQVMNVELSTNFSKSWHFQHC